ncbi:RNA polymerase sigma factor [Actinocrispum wychmicini]|uniref:RNA polymerase sigma-70 factor (ECF subfamily) n=1 Tax=Actinocrispum wychmicini TaxID=1213861 RepID=A0A4R2JX74_9PSEU|nr:sigma-70 family RNA polymerase sigma factor [Actinocrispum wychmicini]TCO65103.1 RNA polymerase sigma-70 factor (ECF subfamily) [Actinocrispum wychmicini]
MPDSLAEIFRAEWARIVAALVRYCGDLHIAEDAAQEAFAAAAVRWPVDGTPNVPRAWLLTTARNRAIDRLRRDRNLSEKLRLLQQQKASEAVVDTSSIPDERLELMFLCCHPALAPEARVGLTLRAVGGLDTAEIARAFLVSEETMKRRLTRARTKIRDAGIPFGVPDEHLLPARLDTVIAVLYLIFNQGYGDGRTDLAAEAIRLTRVLDGLLPERPRVTALLALMLLHDSRRAARVRDGQIVPLADQDRSLWDVAQIAEGRALLDGALARGADGPYALQAAIANLQTEDPIDWPSVANLYDALLRETHSAVVALNRAVAIAETDGPAAALAIVDALDLGDYRYLHSTRAELLHRLGDTAAAREAYDRALNLATTNAERQFLHRRRTELTQ